MLPESLPAEFGLRWLRLAAASGGSAAKEDKSIYLMIIRHFFVVLNLLPAFPIIPL